MMVFSILSMLTNLLYFRYNKKYMLMTRISESNIREKKLFFMAKEGDGKSPGCKNREKLVLNHFIS
jgi:hypothetical protein